MHRHRRHLSLDSYSLTSLRGPPVSQKFTLQSGPHTPTGLRTARLTAHTSPLALADAIAPPLSPKIETGDEMDDMEEEMERMVSSVVNTPVDPNLSAEPSPPLSNQSELGLGLPGTLQAQQMQARKALSTPSTRSLLGHNNHEPDPKVSMPKLNMGMRAAFGNYRKRCLSGGISAAVQIAQSITPEVLVSDASPITQTLPHQAAPPDATPSTPLNAQTTKTGPLSIPGDRPMLHRRSASAGTLPSLDQIRDWSLRRQGVLENTIEENHTASIQQSQNKARESENLPMNANGRTSALSPPAIHIHGASPPRLPKNSGRINRLQQVLEERKTNYRISRPVSLPSSPVNENAPSFPIASSKQDRSHCARQMVHMLEKRKSLTLIS